MSEPRLFVYRIVRDFNVAPCIDDGVLTLTLCKSRIRARAKAGDYIMALVALQHKKIVGKGDDRFYKVAYLFKITEDPVPMYEYEDWCKAKFPTCKTRRANCIYGKNGTRHNGGPVERVHLDGKFSLISNKPHYAAWTSEHPYTLTDCDMCAIGSNVKTKMSKENGMRDYFSVGLESEQVDTLNALIRKGPKSGEK
jgi:hypothetical protein